MTVQEVIEAKTAALADIAAAKTAADAEALRIKYLGRNGLVPALMQEMKNTSPADRPAMGRELNALREAVGEAIRAKQDETAAAAAAGEAFDFSLPGTWRGLGSMHPVSSVIEETTRIFAQLGFTVADGPDVETAFNNFDALNTAPHHPSRDARDTFWLEDGRLLRTQTSPVQIRVMQGRKPPVRIINTGRCYRRDTTDATHAANFHQIEGLYVDRKVSMADLKGDLTYFAKQLMGSDVKVRFRPHFFPFTEPSIEYDFSCHVCGGKGCRVCKHSGWIEISGAGMVNPKVFEIVGYDPTQVTGYAFGMGVERIAMILLGIPDIRMVYENDVRFLEQF